MPNLADTTILGSLHLAYDADRRYKIDILSPPLPPEMCSQYAPSISLVSANRYDTLDVINDEYQLWDLETIESIVQIRNISIRVEYLCEIYYPVDPVTIPITFGKPFGKDSSLQQVTLIRHLPEEATTE